jgi:outer membrane murein-binding lipoprotein Lpp
LDLATRRLAKAAIAAAIILGFTVSWGYQYSQNSVAATHQVATLSAQLARSQQDLYSASATVQSARSEASTARANARQARACLTMAREEINTLKLAARYLGSSVVTGPNLTQPRIAMCKGSLKRGAIYGLTAAVYEARGIVARTEAARQTPVSPSAPNPTVISATARCNDGTYSFSQHHSGTCSWHGGVAAWL